MTDLKACALLFSLLLTLLLTPGCGGDDDDSAVGDDDDSATGDDDDSVTGDDDDSATGDDDDDDDSAWAGAPDSYRFESRFEPGTSSVVNPGQMFRQVLMIDMKAHISAMTGRLDDAVNPWAPSAGDVVQELNFYFDWDGTGLSVPHSISTDPPAAQTLYEHLHSTGKSLKGKIAGNDSGQTTDWSTGLVGWNAAGSTTPEGLVLSWFQQLEDQATDWSNGSYPLDPNGNAVSSVYKTAEGHDVQQLLQKFLMGAVSFSQAADDYMDEGLAKDNTAAADGKPYTDLEHAWDEGFGYYGAAHNNGASTDAEIEETPYADADGNGLIDLLSEYNWGHSVNAAKRDVGSADGAAPTDFSAGAFDAFVAGRHLISSTEGALSNEQMTELEGYRDTAIANWEKAIAATVVHYINDVLQDMETFNATDPATGASLYSFDDHSKHWSELKGFALSLQFNPNSPLSASDFEYLHNYIGMAPALPGGGGGQGYKKSLNIARFLLADAYGFDAANIGDTFGENGW